MTGFQGNIYDDISVKKALQKNAILVSKKKRVNGINHVEIDKVLH